MKRITLPGPPGTLPIALILLAIAAAMVGFGFYRIGGGDPSISNQAEVDYGRVHEGICLARVAAQEGDADGSRDLFFSRVHSDLHVVADRTVEVDRGRAATLLRSKNAVERAYQGEGAAKIARELGVLLRESQLALESLGAFHSPCPPQT